MVVTTQNGLADITNVLHGYIFQPDDHERTISCNTAGPWLRDDDNHETSGQLNVICKNSLLFDVRIFF